MKYILIVIGSLSVLLNSCKKEVNLSIRKVEIQPFDHIQLENAFDLYISEGSTFSAYIKGDEKVIEKVSLVINGDTLYISDNRSLRWTTPTKNKIEVYVTSPPLKSIQTNGGSAIRTLTPITSEEFGLILSGKSCEAEIDLNGDKFYYWNNFPTGGKLTLRGKTNVLKIWNVALMSVDARNLNSNVAIIENSSKGDCVVEVNDKLEYSIKGTGNIEVYGNPAEIIELEVTSTGQLISH
ncbi:MAG: head GIN domain-containing protein [Brumimicrobium sp.]|nr:head GIN domain-containing protein [Brumimicrobium sp.]